MTNQIRRKGCVALSRRRLVFGLATTLIVAAVPTMSYGKEEDIFGEDEESYGEEEDIYYRYRRRQRRRRRRRCSYSRHRC